MNLDGLRNASIIEVLAGFSPIDLTVNIQPTYDVIVGWLIFTYLFTKTHQKWSETWAFGEERCTIFCFVITLVTCKDIEHPIRWFRYDLEGIEGIFINIMWCLLHNLLLWPIREVGLSRTVIHYKQSSMNGSLPVLFKN